MFFIFKFLKDYYQKQQVLFLFIKVFNCIIFYINMIKEKGKNEFWVKYDLLMYIYCFVKYKLVRLVINI